MTHRRRTISWLILLFAILNAILYSSLLPLWEGFDEAFHYGYVQHLSAHGSLLVLNQTPVSEEIWQALQAQPVSHYIQESTQAPLDFSGYFSLPQEQRARLRQRLESIPARDKYQPHAGLLNYEAYQAPLPYLFLALPDRLLSPLPITRRVLYLRLLLSVTSAVLVYIGIGLVASRLEMAPEYATAAALCVFSSQMLYGVLSHVCNDALAVPAMLFFIWAALGVAKAPSAQPYAALGATLGLGLLIKAYFLCMVPFALLLLCWRRERQNVLAAAGIFLAVLVALVGPSYARNLAIYHSLDGTTKLASGLGFRQALDALAHIPWGRSITYMAKSSLWTGNNSFTTFSAKTLTLVLLLIAAAMGLYFYHWKRIRQGEAVVAGAIAVFCAALFFVTLASYYATRGLAIAAVPWYAQVLLAPVLLVGFLGMSRAESIGRWLATGTLLIWSYVICATYVLKLIPQYGGFRQAHAHLPDLYSWYIHGGAERSSILSTLLLTPAWWIYALACATVVLSVFLCLRSVVCLLAARS